MKSIIRYIALLLAAIFVSKIRGQEAISIFGRVYANPENGPGYFQPMSNVLNQGLSMHWQTHRPQVRPRIGVSIIATRSFLPDSYKSFDATYTANLDDQEMRISAPTVFGRNEAIVVTESNGYGHVFPGGLEYRYFTIAQPQVTVEGLFNSAASLRFVAFNLDEEVGDFNNFGISVLHHFAPYFDLESTILTGALGFETIHAGDIWDANYHYVQLTAGRFGRVFHLYGSLGMQWYTQSVSYEEPFENFAVQKIDIPADNRLLFNLGAGYQWSILSAGVEIAPLNPFTFGLQVGLKI